MNDRAEFLARRRKGIGGSDIAAILGVSPWKSALDVYLDKVGQSDDQPSNAEAVYWGIRLEDVVAEEYRTRTQAQVQRVRDQLRHKHHAWAIGNIDRAIVTKGSRARATEDGSLLGADGLLECKTGSAFTRAAWGRDDDEDAIPVHYAAQGMWYLAVTGLAWCDFAALIGGQRFVIKRLHRDEETIAHMLAAGEEFWHRHVLAGVPPEARTERDVQRLFPEDNGESIEATEQLLAAFNAAREAKARLAAAEADLDAATEQIKLGLQERSVLTLHGQPIVTWKAAKASKKTDWKAVASELSAPADVIAAHTTEVPGSRRFILKDI